MPGSVVATCGSFELVGDLRPPVVHGIAAIAGAAYTGQGLGALLTMIGPVPASGPGLAAALFDRSLAHRLCFHAPEADALLANALSLSRLFRVADGPRRRSQTPLRLLALVEPGDLMANTPLEFITAHLDVRLDLLFVSSSETLPTAIPDHDLAFCAVGEPNAAMARALKALYDVWPRPMLNDPSAIRRLSREAVAQGLDHCSAILSPEIRTVTRAQLQLSPTDQAGIGAFLAGPAIIRPLGSHAGYGLKRIDGTAELTCALETSDATHFYVSRFVDYRDADGLFRKYRVALIDGRPHLCHMASSEHWMVHYLNAGMSESAARRADEERAMATFDEDFARRHADAFAFIAEWLGLDYSQVDCAEAPDGRLLVFEVDVAAIVHLMDPPDLFPYKPARMRRVFDAFGAMLAARIGT